MKKDRNRNKVNIFNKNKRYKILSIKEKKTKEEKFYESYMGYVLSAELNMLQDGEYHLQLFRTGEDGAYPSEYGLLTSKISNPKCDIKFDTTNKLVYVETANSIYVLKELNDEDIPRF